MCMNHPICTTKLWRRFGLAGVVLVVLLGTVGQAAAQTCPPGNSPITTPDSRYSVTEPVSGEYVVTDLETGLMWKQCSEGRSGAGCATGTNASMTWSNALATANVAAHAGFNDWRLPTRNELRSLVETSCYSPSINSNSFPATDISNYWTSTTRATDTPYALLVHFSDGQLTAAGKTYGFGVRLVRGGRWLDSFASESDTVPDALTLVAQLDVPLSSLRVSDPVTVTGMNTGAVTGIGVSGTPGSQYSINSTDDADFTSTPGAVKNADQVRVRHTSAATSNTDISSTLTIGGVSADFITTTGKLDQSIGFGVNPGPLTYGGPSGSVSATATSTLAVTFSTASLACTVDANTGAITILAAGQCVVLADQAGNANYNPAPQVQQTVVIDPRAITVTADARSKVYGAVDPVLSYSVSPALIGSDSLTGALARAAGEGVGSYAINQGTLSASSNYTLSYVGADFSITPAPQTLTFPAQTVTSRALVPNETFVISPLASSATPNSGQPIAYSSPSPSVCSVSGSTVTMFATGTCVLAADQAGNGNYLAADQVTSQVEITAPVTADLYVQVTLDRDRALLGDVVMWSIEAGNLGPADVTDANLIVVPSERLGDVVWECVSGACPVPDAGQDGIDTTLSLPSGGIVALELFGTILAAPGGGDSYTVIETQASMALPAGSGLSDPISANNADTDGVQVVPTLIFEDGFEQE